MLSTNAETMAEAAAASGGEGQAKEDGDAKAKAAEAEVATPLSPAQSSFKSAEQEQEAEAEAGEGGGSGTAEHEAQHEEEGGRADARYGGYGGGRRGHGGGAGGGMHGRGGGGRGAGPRRPFVSTGHASDAPVPEEGPVRVLDVWMEVACYAVVDDTKHMNAIKLPQKQARFFVIKSFSPSDVVASIHHRFWASTEPGNARLDRCE